MRVRASWDPARRVARIGGYVYADDPATGRYGYGGLLASAALAGYLPADPFGACDTAALARYSLEAFVEAVAGWLVATFGEERVRGGRAGRTVNVQPRLRNPGDPFAAGVATIAPGTTYHDAAVIVRLPDVGERE